RRLRLSIWSPTTGQRSSRGASSCSTFRRLTNSTWAATGKTPWRFRQASRSRTTRAMSRRAIPIPKRGDSRRAFRPSFRLCQLLKGERAVLLQLHLGGPHPTRIDRVPPLFHLSANVPAPRPRAQTLGLGYSRDVDFGLPPELQRLLLHPH